MFSGWATQLGVDWRALIGTIVLHIAVLAAVLAWPVKLSPPEPATIPIVLVDLSELIEVTPEPEIVPVPPTIAEEDRAPPEIEVLPKVDTPDVLEPAPPEVPEADSPNAARLLPPAPTVRPSIEDADDEEASKAIVIDPRYKIPFDPFAEIAPSAMSRVIMATTCARSSRAARPDYCPNYSDEDRYYSAFDSNRNADGTYDPVADAARAEEILQRVASGRSGLAAFSARQARHAPTGSPVPTGPSPLPRHPEGLQNCLPVQTGLQGPGGLNPDLAIPLGSTDGINCR